MRSDARGIGKASVVSSSDLVMVALAVFVAATVYMIAGFGFALLAMPLMTFAIPVEQAVVVVALLAVSGTSTQAWKHRHDIRRPLARRLVIGSYTGMPLGIVLLNTVDDRILRIVLGAGVIVATLMLIRDLTLDHIGPTLEYAMGFLSGTANTSIGTNGPPLVFALQSRRLRPDEFRGTIGIVFALGNLFSVVLFVIAGKVTGDGLRAAAIALPAWIVGMALGNALQPRIPERHFRSLVLGLLLVTGTTTIVAAL